MLIDNKNHSESAYTKLLNKKYPQRKYLKHNLSSWLRFQQKNKENSKEKSKSNSKEKDFNAKTYNKHQYQNQKVDYSDLNLRKLTFNQEEILESENFDTTDLKKALELIESLKNKLMEYEIINNKNIEVSCDLVEKIKHENEFYKQKLLNVYEELNFYKEKYDDDILETNGLYDHRRYLVKSLRSKWLKFNFFFGLKNRIEKIKKIKKNYFEFHQRKNYLLIFKGFLGLEKNRINEIELKKLKEKRDNRNKVLLFNLFKKNFDEKKRHEKFDEIKKSISIILSFKNLRYNLSLRKYYSELNEKALFKYYLKTSRKIFLALRQNILTKSSTLKYKKKFEDSKKINFTNFFKNFKNLNSLGNKERINKTKGLTLLKRIFEIKQYKLIIKFKSEEFNNYFIDCFDKWKSRALYPTKLKTYYYILSIKLMQLFFKRVKNSIKVKQKKQNFLSSSIYSPKNTYRHAFVVDNNFNNFNNFNNEMSLYSSCNSFRNTRKSFFNTFFKNCINIIKKRNINKYQKFYEFSRDLYYKKFLNNLKSLDFDPNIRYVNLKLNFKINYNIHLLNLFIEKNFKKIQIFKFLRKN